MELPARPSLPRCDPHTTFSNGKIFIAVIAADHDESLKQLLMLCLAIPHQETLNILTHSKQCVCHVPADYTLPSPYSQFSA